MYRLCFVLAFGVILFTTCSYAQNGIEELILRVIALEGKVQGLEGRLSVPQVDCYETSTPFDEQSNKPIMYLDRQNVSCPEPYVLAQFVLQREGDFGSAKVRYVYKCCKVVM